MTLGVATPHDRRVPIATAFNLRDFGGYATTDGRTVRRGMLYRCGTMSLLTDEDANQLRALGIRAICDFRRPSERREEPTRWHGDDVDYHCRDFNTSTGVLGEMLRGKAVTQEEMRQAMIALYREIAMEYAPSYRAMFDQILAGRVPILINCSAGKDRTGVGAALILAALGVPRATIVEDYMLTNAHADWDWRLSLGESRLAHAHRTMKEVIAPVLTADALYIETLFETLDATHGGVEAYLEQVLGVDTPARAAMRDILLEP
ncbi:tyrosine-protein phosphatase [Sphingobium sp. AN558]|uniref:tyrosine-protein phosphatase n=1 Tax=Sphingobium sp. AN558 TaxID=3133442 RepID=UPI0030BE74F5